MSLTGDTPPPPPTLAGYEPPAIAVLGSLAQVTRGAVTGSGSDGTFSGSIVGG